MTEPIRIETLTLKGFRAYLKPQSFSFYRGKTPLSFVVFAANAKGKSSLIDAFEFFFSDDATLSRLGIRAADRNAGRGALEHVDAQNKRITPSVHISFRQGTETFGDTRPVKKQGTPHPPAATRVFGECALPFIIRGHQLRSFVEDQTAEDRYQEIATWFGFQPLVQIQKNLRALRRDVKQKAESTQKRDERLRDLRNLTKQTLTDWEDALVLQWLNENVIQKLDSSLSLTSFSPADVTYQELQRRKQAEEEKLGLPLLNQTHILALI